MNLNKYLEYIEFGLSNHYFLLILLTILTMLIKRLFLIIIEKQLSRINSNKTKYKLLQFLKFIITLIEWIVIYLIWEENIQNMMTLISFVSAALTLSLKDIILNFFAGVYIKLGKPFKLEDRVVINNYKGDVINIGSFSFDILEVDSKYGNQSTGIIITLPNSVVFSYPVKNLNKGFKYIWDEIKINIELDSDIEKTKEILYKIINNVDLVKSTPTKMKNQLKHNTSYRMYFNNFEPVIYTNVKDNYIELDLRFLIHFKKARGTESYIWNEILKEYQNGNLKLKNY